MSTGSGDNPMSLGASTVAAIATAIPSELPHSSGWTSQMEKLVLPQVMLGHHLHEGKPCIGQLALCAAANPHPTFTYHVESETDFVLHSHLGKAVVIINT